jgi:hypothetical protein
VWRLLLLLAALDTLGCGLCATVEPSSLFTFLGMPLSLDIPPDRLQLWWALGFVALAHAVFLAILTWRPEAHGPLALVPLIGRAIPVGLWLWAGCTARLEWPSRVPPFVLAAHEAVWLLVLAGFLLAWWHWRRTTAEADPLPLADRKSS